MADIVVQTGTNRDSTLASRNFLEFAFKPSLLASPAVSGKMLAGAPREAAFKTRISRAVATTAEGAIVGSMPWLGAASSKKLALSEFSDGRDPIFFPSRLQKKFGVKYFRHRFPSLVRPQKLIENARAIPLTEGYWAQGWRGKEVWREYDTHWHASSAREAKQASKLTFRFRTAAAFLGFYGAIVVCSEAQNALKLDGALRGKDYAFGYNFKKFAGRTIGTAAGSAIGGGAGRFLGGTYNSKIVIGGAAVGGAIGSHIGEAIAEKI